MARRKVLTPLQKEYKKQVTRIKRFIKRATKRGYVFPENIIPPQPKRITKQAVEKLREITPPSMYKEAYYVEKETGEALTGYEGRKKERKLAAKKGRITKLIREYSPTYDYYRPTYDEEFYARNVIDNFKQTLNHYNHAGSMVLSKWIDSLVLNYGANNVATMLERGAEAGIIVTYDTVYKSALTRTYMTEMINYLPTIEPEDKVSYGEEFMDALENDDDFGLPV